MKNSYKLLYIDAEGIDILYKQLINKHIVTETHNENSCQSAEQKCVAIEELERVLIYLYNTEDAGLFTSLEDAAKYLLVKKDNVVFINTNATFDIPQICSGIDNESIVREINKSKIILYCRQINNSLIVMPSCMFKYPPLQHCLRSKQQYLEATCPEEMLINYFKGKNVPVNVFGAMYCGRKYLQIKPYVIRLATYLFN